MKKKFDRKLQLAIAIYAYYFITHNYENKF